MPKCTDIEPQKCELLFMDMGPQQCKPISLIIAPSIMCPGLLLWATNFVSPRVQQYELRFMDESPSMCPTLLMWSPAKWGSVNYYWPHSSVIPSWVILARSILCSGLLILPAHTEHKLVLQSDCDTYSKRCFTFKYSVVQLSCLRSAVMLVNVHG